MIKKSTLLSRVRSMVQKEVIVYREKREPPAQRIGDAKNLSGS